MAIFESVIASQYRMGYTFFEEGWRHSGIAEIIAAKYDACKFAVIISSFRLIIVSCTNPNLKEKGDRDE